MIRNAIFLAITLTSFSAIAATNDIKTVTLENATYCHLTASGDYVEGYASFIGTYTADGSEFSFISPGNSGNIPLIKKGDKQYIVIDHADAADEYTFEYKPE